MNPPQYSPKNRYLMLSSIKEIVKRAILDLEADSRTPTDELHNIISWIDANKESLAFGTDQKFKNSIYKICSSCRAYFIKMNGKLSAAKKASLLKITSIYSQFISE